MATKYTVVLETPNGKQTFQIDSTTGKELLERQKQTRVKVDRSPKMNPWMKLNEDPKPKDDPVVETPTVGESKKEKKEETQKKNYSGNQEKGVNQDRKPLMLVEANLSQLTKAFFRGLEYDRVHKEVKMLLGLKLLDLEDRLLRLETSNNYVMGRSIPRDLFYRKMGFLNIDKELLEVRLYRSYLSDILVRIAQVVEFCYRQVRSGYQVYDSYGNRRKVFTPEVEAVANALKEIMDTYFVEEDKDNMFKQLSEAFEVARKNVREDVRYERMEENSRLRQERQSAYEQKREERRQKQGLPQETPEQKERRLKAQAEKAERRQKQQDIVKRHIQESKERQKKISDEKQISGTSFASQKEQEICKNRFDELQE